MHKRAVLGLLLAFTLAAVLNAAPIDPRIIINSDPPNPTPVTGLVFTFGSNANGGGVLPFINETNLDWLGLAISVDLPTGSIVNCLAGDLFQSCFLNSRPIGGGITEFTMFYQTVPNDDADDKNPPGIVRGQDFTINLNDLLNGKTNLDPNGSGGWGPDTDFTAEVSGILSDSVPEPATFAVVGSGLLMLLAWRRQRRTG